MPSEFFYTINAIIPVVLSIIGFIFGILITFIIIKNRKFHTVHHLLKCDMCITSAVYFLIVLVSCSFTLRNDWEFHQPICRLCAYLITVIVDAVSNSFLIQAISRLFFSNFYTYRFLLTWRTHMVLILFKWSISFLLMAEPWFIEGGFELIREYRTCSISISILSVAVYSIVINFVIPASVVSTAFMMILKQVHQSMRQIGPTIQTNSTIVRQHISRPSRKHLKIMQHMMTLMNIFGLGGAPYSIVVLWNSIRKHSVPEEFYFISTNLIVFGATVLMVVTLIKDRQIKETILKNIYVR